METNKYKYQITAAKATLNMALNIKYIASVLAACPGSGKSTIVIHILNEYLQKNPQNKVVILTHNQNILKSQMLNGFENPNVTPMFSFGEFGSNSQVEVGLPSNASKISEFNMLVVDEAHQYYAEDMIDSIVKKFNPKQQILMTGSPSKFIKHNNENNSKYGIYYIAANDLMSGVFSSIDLDVVRYDGKILLDKIKAVFKKSKDNRYNMTKVMWACSSIKEAKAVSYYLKNNFNKKVFISTSENDSENKQIKNFVDSKDGYLIVVNKGILGFSDNTITSLVDFKCSKDLDNRNQFFARGLRVHPEGIRKTYISTSNTKNWNTEGAMLNKVVNFMNRSFFMSYEG